jgi:hypothetical protein
LYFVDASLQVHIQQESILEIFSYLMGSSRKESRGKKMSKVEREKKSKCEA